MNCPNCGTANVATAKFCSSCGTRFVTSDMAGLAHAANTAMNLQLVALVGMVAGFLVGGVIGAYLLYPMGGWGVLAGIGAPLLGIYLGGRAAISWAAGR